MPIRRRTVWSFVMAGSLAASLLAGCAETARQAQDTGGSPSPATSGGDRAALAVSPGASAAAGSAAPGAVSPTAPASGIARTPIYEGRGCYVTATSMVLPTRLKALLSGLKAAGGNLIVIDAKDEGGIVSWQSKVPLAHQIHADKEGPIRDLKERVAFVHSYGVKVAGRIVCFNDPILAKARPDLCPRHVNGGVWKENGRQVWVDPSKPEAQNYNIDLAKEMIAAGVDEVQFDYIRFPAQGDTQNARYSYDMKAQQKHEIITSFLTRAYDAIHPTGAVVSCDVYGIMAWAQPIDVKITGQLLEDMARHTDVLCPMVYPSHFSNGFAGIANPADSPYLFVEKGVRLLQKKVAGSGVQVRPWVQAMHYKVSNFTPHYVYEELRAARDAKATGWLLWNAQNKYDVGFAGAKAFTQGK